jgi:hypothetical protein
VAAAGDLVAAGAVGAADLVVAIAGDQALTPTNDERDDRAC